MKLQAYSKVGEKTKEVEVPAVFDKTISAQLFTRYVNYLRAAGRHPIADTLGRGEVSGGGKKPWKQKGTGNARVGSTRSPLWVGGGVTFGPTSLRNFQLRMNKKERRAALLGLLNRLLVEGKVVLVADFDFSEPKTKTALDLITALGAEGKIALVCQSESYNACLSFRNIEGVKVMMPERLDFIYLLTADKILIDQKSLELIAQVYSNDKTERENDDK